MMRTVILAVSMVLLSGCGMSDKLDAMTLGNHKKVCDGYDFTKGTDANCLMRQDELEDADEQKMMDREDKQKK